MNVRQSIQEGQFCVFRRVSSRWVSWFYTFIEVRAFVSVFIIITLFLCVNCRNEKQETIWSNEQETSKEKGKASMLGEQRRDAFINRCRMQQNHRFQSITQHMLRSICDSTFGVRKLTKAACLRKILKLLPGEGKSAKGWKRTRKARIKEQRQFSMRD